MNTDFHIDADRGQLAQKTREPPQRVKAGRENLHASEPTTILGSLKRKRQREENAILASVLSKATGAGGFVPKRKPASSRNLRWDLPGFERNCRVATQFGYLPVQALRKRDKVKTLSGVYREVQWIDEIRLDEDFLAHHPEAYPVLLRKNVFGEFQSFHMYGIIGSAVGLGILFIWLFKKFKIKNIEGKEIHLPTKNKSFTRYILGGTIFGLGWALAGACPGPMYILLGTGVASMLVVIAAATLGTFVYGVLKNKLPH